MMRWRWRWRWSWAWQYLPESDRSEIGLFFLSQLENESLLIELAGRYDSIEQEAFREEHDDDDDDEGDYETKTMRAMELLIII